MRNSHTYAAPAKQLILDASVILADDRGMPRYEWSRDSTIINKIDVRYAYNEIDLVEGDFAQRRVYVADKSRDIYDAQPIQPFELRGVHDALGGEDLTDELALLYMQRWGYAPPILKLSLSFRMHTLEPGDRPLVTDPLIRNPITGKLGLDRERFEVLRVTPHWLTEGRIDVEMLWIGAIETSPIPVKKLSNLFPGQNQFDGTDVPIPLGGSVTLTTGVASKFGVGFRRHTLRRWACVFNVTSVDPFNPQNPQLCIPDGTRTIRQNYTGSMTYRLDYKTESAPDAVGSEGDPTTGWVELRAPQTRGSVSFLNGGDCSGADPGGPSAEFFNHFFEEPLAAPAVYHIKVHYMAVGVQSAPCGSIDPNLCNPDLPGSCTNATLNSSVLETDMQDFSVDYHQTVT